MDCKIKDKNSGGFIFWENWYKRDNIENMPWYFTKLDCNVADALKTYNIKSGNALDLGTGPGTQACRLAEMGFNVTGSDISPTAIARAKKYTSEQGLSVEFIIDDILDSNLKGPFEFILDRGCFHVLPPEKRADYVLQIQKLLNKKGYLLLKTFSTEEPYKEGGPYRFSPKDIASVFQSSFEILSVGESLYEGPVTPFPLALFCVIRAHG